MPDAGQCGIHKYPGYSKSKIDAVLAALRANGATVSGDNPWSVDTRKHGVKLSGAWDAASSELRVTVADKNFYVSCDKVWETLDQLLGHVGNIAAEDIPLAVANLSDTVRVSRVQPILYQHDWSFSVAGTSGEISLQVIYSGGDQFVFQFSIHAFGSSYSHPVTINADLQDGVDIGHGLELLISVSSWAFDGRQLSCQLTLSVKPPFGLPVIRIASTSIHVAVSEVPAPSGSLHDFIALLNLTPGNPDPVPPPQPAAVVSVPTLSQIRITISTLGQSKEKFEGAIVRLINTRTNRVLINKENLGLDTKVGWDNDDTIALPTPDGWWGIDPGVNDADTLATMTSSMRIVVAKMPTAGNHYHKWTMQVRNVQCKLSNGTQYQLLDEQPPYEFQREYSEKSYDCNRVV